jgi:cellulose synthase/poly-beta-1,6-N-acetylglucosamine synthase-like glycosyltransferase
MISVVIPTLNDEAVLGRALAPLVPAAVAGLVREVIVVDGGSTDTTLDIADDAGCRILAGQPQPEERLRAAARKAVCDWLMLVPPDVQLLPGWEQVVRQHVETRAGEGASLPLTATGARAWLASLLGPRAPDVLVVARSAYAEEGRPRSLRRLQAGCALLIRAPG